MLDVFAEAEAASAVPDAAPGALGGTGTAEVLASLGFSVPAQPPAAVPTLAGSAYPSAVAAAPGAATAAAAAAAAAAAPRQSVAAAAAASHQAVEVYVRVRPLSTDERTRGEASTLTVTDDKTLLTSAPVVSFCQLCACSGLRCTPLPNSPTHLTRRAHFLMHTYHARLLATEAGLACSSTPLPAPLATARTMSACSRRLQSLAWRRPSPRAPATCSFPMVRGKQYSLQRGAARPQSQGSALCAPPSHSLPHSLTSPPSRHDWLWQDAHHDRHHL